MDGGNDRETRSRRRSSAGSAGAAGPRGEVRRGPDGPLRRSSPSSEVGNVSSVRSRPTGTFERRLRRRNLLRGMLEGGRREPLRLSGAPLHPGLYAGLVLLSALAWLVTGDWIAPLAIWVLWAGWRFLPAGEGPPVLAMAFTFQWVQVTAGLWYHAVTGIRLPAIDVADHRPMMLIGLGCLVALAAGLRAGVHLVRPFLPPLGDARPAFGWRSLIAVYLASV